MCLRYVCPHRQWSPPFQGSPGELYAGRVILAHANDIGNAGDMRLCGCHHGNACVARTILVLACHGTVSSARRCLILMSLWSPLFWEKGGSIDSCGIVCGRGLFENPRIHTTGVDTAALDSTFSSRLQITNMLKCLGARYKHLFCFDVLSERI